MFSMHYARIFEAHPMHHIHLFAHIAHATLLIPLAYIFDLKRLRAVYLFLLILPLRNADISILYAIFMDS